MTIRPMKYNSLDMDTVGDFIADHDFAAQPKLDGIRLFLHVSDAGFDVLSSSGEPLKSATAGPITRALYDISKKSGVIPTLQDAAQASEFYLDGEVLLGRDLWLFDSIVPGQEDDPMIVRYDQLERVMPMLASFAPFAHQLNLAVTPADKRRLLEVVHAAGGEGLMFKSLESPYEPGHRVKHSLKAKFTSTVDCVVMEVGVGTSAKKTLGGAVTEKINIKLGLFNYEGDLEPIGRTSALGKGTFFAGDVVEVRYLSWDGTTGARLVQPTILRARPDKTPNEFNCGFSQLRVTNKDLDLVGLKI